MRKAIKTIIVILVSFFMFYACEDTGSSSGSNDSTDNTDNTDDSTAPSVPQSVTATAGNGQATIVWKIPTDAGKNRDGTQATIIKYRIYYSTDSIFYLTETSYKEHTDVSTYSFTVLGLPNNIQYYFVVTALNAAKESEQSTEVSATPNTPSLNGVLVNWQMGNKNKNIVPVKTDTAISTAAELEAMTVNGTYHLTAHIDLNKEAWTPLHDKDAPFTGTLHGNGYIIYNLKIDAPTEDYQGLFAALNNATIDNLGIGVSSITAKAVAGGLAGHVAGTSSMLTNVAVGHVDTHSEIVVSGEVVVESSDRGSYAGGVVGYMGSGSLTGALNEGLAVRATGTTDDSGTVGGLVGHNNKGGIVIGSVSGKVSSVNGFYVGGLVGNNYGHVTGSVNGTVSSTSGNRVGGLVGYNNTGGMVIGSVRGNVSSVRGFRVGGLIGFNAGEMNGSSIAIVSVVSGDDVGGLVGRNETNDPSKTVGLSRGWVMVGSTNTHTGIGATVGYSTESPKVYYNSKGGDHVGTMDKVSEKQVNLGDTEDSGTRGSNDIGDPIDEDAVINKDDVFDIDLPRGRGTAAGDWIFSLEEWPSILLPDGVTNHVSSMTASPPKPDNFID